MERKMYQYTCY